jgi:glycosyltransferase involved in cell wall biosynthesis
VDYYLPSFKAGGPVRSLSNTIEVLGDEFEFRVVTSDRDLGDATPFDEIQNGQWKRIGKAQVLYLSPKSKRIGSWKRLLNSIEYDLIYLNSFFSTLTVMTLFLRRIGKIPNKPILLAVRGEFGRGALSLKRFKKRIYLFLAKRCGLCSDISWHASSQYELAEMLSELHFPRHSAFVSAAPIFVAPDLPRDVGNTTNKEEPKPVKHSGSVRAIFLSRIARKKNLDLALKLLSKAKGKVLFDIYGPLEDVDYWRECQELMGRLPADITANYRGMVHPKDVARVFSQYHLFLFPTRSENFGHVILEAFCGGCIVLTSDATAWRGLESRMVGWDLPLSYPERYCDALNEAIEMDTAEFEKRSLLARRFGQDFINDPGLIEANRKMFWAASNASE